MFSLKPKTLLKLVCLFGLLQPIQGMADRVYILGCFPDFDLEHHNLYLSYVDNVKNCDLYSGLSFDAQPKKQHSHITLNKNFDIISPSLIASMLEKGFISAQFFIYRASDNGSVEKLSHIRIDNAMVKNVSSGYSASTPNSNVTEQVILSYQNLKITNSHITGPESTVSFEKCIGSKSTSKFDCDL